MKVIKGKEGLSICQFIPASGDSIAAAIMCLEPNQTDLDWLSHQEKPDHFLLMMSSFLNHTTITSPLGIDHRAFKVYKDKAFSQEVRLLACS
eukprot:1145947-Pelagomonas_calceolata.AAC.8